MRCWMPVEGRFLSLACVHYYASYDSLRDSCCCGARVIQGKPNRGDHVRIVTIPDDRLALRFFDGGMERDGIFLFDFVDTHTKKAVNCPSTYEIHALPNPYHMLNMPGRLLSWEATRGIPPNVIKKGEERFSVPEGTPCALVRPGKERFMFAVPQRPRELLPGVQLVTATDAQW